ncbi:DUF1653 domain-containing protein [Ancylobacter dichloromethanicus]|uniref:DUF1653 domain-containing protein n=1 Tax=Ancylobacter dichloromethanicus TaxID=518825 RepID=A0A9W6JBR2_9HYPH|nr:DUF1653 domain-containing protein [Ancylobacter dichloromethanicus]GLK74581.1 hypothetical protein GCM10017643_46990 [Ancylobacter dichloromethanicus]
MPSSPIFQAAKGTVFRHRKRGSTYTVVASATLQTNSPISDDASVVIYQSEDGKLWVRPVDEFFDGRFEELSPKDAPP